MKRAFVYVKPDVVLPTDQKSLQEWTNNTDYKIKKLHSTFDALNQADKYQYGCEFEFYIHTTKHRFNELIDEIVKEIYELTDVEILVDTLNLLTEKDKNNCIQIKPDISLEDNGIEISVPITTASGIEHYIQTICPIINKYGYTNEETGFHIHISTVYNDGINFNFYKFMLLCDNAKLLSLWEPRIGYRYSLKKLVLNLFQR